MAKKHKSSLKVFPKQVFVHFDEQADEPFLVVDKTAELAIGGNSGPVQVAIYKLIETGEVSTAVTYKRKKFTKV
jgi:hypothetical protein